MSRMTLRTAGALRPVAPETLDAVTTKCSQTMLGDQGVEFVDGFGGPGGDRLHAVQEEVDPSLPVPMGSDAPWESRVLVVCSAARPTSRAWAVFPCAMTDAGEALGFVWVDDRHEVGADHGGSHDGAASTVEVDRLRAPPRDESKGWRGAGFLRDLVGLGVDLRLRPTQSSVGAGGISGKSTSGSYSAALTQGSSPSNGRMILAPPFSSRSRSKRPPKQ